MTETPKGSRGDLLVVSYHFPPIVSAGVFRIVGFAGRLARMGWRTRVLTVDGSPFESADPSTLSLVDPRIDVHRVKTLDPPFLAVRPVGPGLLRRVAGKVRALLRAVYVSVFCHPDKMVSWALPMTWRAWRLLRHRRCVVLSSSPPHSSQFPLVLLRKLVDFRWVADFRDPWTAPARRRRGWLSMKVSRRMEAAVLAGCDRVLVNTEGNRRALLGAFPFVDGHKVAVVTNGFETRSPWASNPGVEDPIDGDMLYMGEVYPGMLDLLLDAMDVLVARGSERVPHIVVYGRITDADLDELRRRGHDGRVEFRGMLQYEESIALMARARSLLLLLRHGADFDTCVPSKMYPYLAAGPPVIALVPEGDAKDILERTGAGVAVTSRDPVAVADRLEELVGRLRNGSLGMPRREETIEEYAMEVLAARVDEILREEAKAW